MLKSLYNNGDNTLLFYIEKIQKYKETKCYFDIKILEKFLEKYKCNFLILIPLLNLNQEPFFL